ncbi:uncharacterized protein [Palaemon carinicauda]|uniref:uncharacterized protein n=1 Tax=Palaemon carinicauda TaxID=392227 RepID=UPI0035B6A313
MKCLRSMAGVSILDRVKTEVVRERKSLRYKSATGVDKNALRWFGLVEKMENGRLLKKDMNARVDEKSPRGKPRFGWMNWVKKGLGDRRTAVRVAKEHARNRNE